MREPHRFLLVTTIALLSIPMGAASAQDKTPITVAELFNRAKPGTWVRLEGTMQADQSITCTKARVITGDIEEDDWTIKGLLRGVEPGTRQLTVGRLKVKLRDPATISSPTVTLRSLADLKPGMYIKVQGTYVAGQGFVARKVEDQSADVAKKMGAEKKILHEGRIERVDPNRRAIVLMGTTFLLSPTTQATTVVKQAESVVKL